MINLLDAGVYNRIAAGEVVERPASVVKELVENSIDAGAKSIVVEIKHGGKELIKVSDDGCGIAYAELSKAFLPHATSKIRTADDLSRIETLGFRGEALPSIASVADVKVISKPTDQETGGCLTFHGDKTEVTDAGSPDGTYFYVENIFSKIPARLKFMEKDFQEEAAVTDLISRLILSHPDISFRYLSDGKKIYQSYGQGVKDALICVYGPSILDSVIAIEADQGEYHLNGFIGRESFSKPNRTYQTLIVNNRFVSNTTVSNAVYYAYADRLMKRQFPFYVLYLSLPAEKIDVNVHPNKLDVRFVDKGAVYGFINVNVALALSQGYKIPDAETKDECPKTVSVSRPVNYVSRNEAISFFSNRTDQSKRLTEPPETENATVFTAADELLRSSLRALALSGDKLSDVGMTERLLDVIESDKTCGIETNPQKKDGMNPAEKYDTAEFWIDISGVVGVAFDTYLIIQMGDTLYWIDQHAAHERLLYDKIKENRSVIEGRQDLLLPYIFSVNTDEDAWLRQNSESIRECGIEIEEFGDRKYKISSVPVVLVDMDLSEFVGAVLADLNVAYRKTGVDFIKDRLMQEACKAAVKGGDRLTDDELAFIMRRVAETNATLMCPHGRPIAVKLARSTVEKWFKRIVS